ncbi:unnamed protein product [Sphenostylis stenocarpa]|uniref:Uncharacterized protein n=1 Tax=Sphenostylis stenocarpa TaxID=92480 RepID=A0AA86VR46_9FABA|nr:unnamed protein product [Sphenostylis stenocarpa]
MEELWLASVSHRSLININTSNKKLELDGAIKWDKLPDHDNKWDDSVVITYIFPEIHLENKVKLVGGDIDRLIHKTNLQVFKRREKVSKEGDGKTNIGPEGYMIGLGVDEEKR